MKEFNRRKRNYEINLELYNVEDDPHQDNNIIDQHPDIVKKLKDHYEKWWARVEPTFSIPRPAHIGNDAENPSFLACNSWTDTYITQRSEILNGIKTNAPWDLYVDQTGEYKIELTRWPKEANTPISGKTDIELHDDYVYGKVLEGKALPITQARIKIDKYDITKPVAKDDKAAAFTVKLKSGPVQLKTWFYDKDGNELCGAYYVYVTRK